MICPLCHSSETKKISIEQKPVATYWHCQTCDLIFLDLHERVDFVEERRRYDEHQNEGPQYETYFREFILGLKTFVPTGKVGLDFGSGPIPVLSRLLKQEGYLVNCYDVHFHPQADVFDQEYDFITSTEVFEHLSEPASVLQRIKRSLVAQGILAITTSLHSGLEAFPQWHYRRDPTHISFYSLQTLKWLASHFGFELLHSAGARHYFRKIS